MGRIGERGRELLLFPVEKISYLYPARSPHGLNIVSPG